MSWNASCPHRPSTPTNTESTTRLTTSPRGYVHGRIKHAERVYVSGDVHTNTIEGFWSLVKRGLEGVYHSVSRKHLQGYLNEYAWRYNQRLEPHAFRAFPRATSSVPRHAL
jgi:hypothetical protein